MNSGDFRALSGKAGSGTRPTLRGHLGMALCMAPGEWWCWASLNWALSPWEMRTTFLTVRVAVISVVCKTLCDTRIEGAGGGKDRTHQGDCCYCVWTPKTTLFNQSFSEALSDYKWHGWEKSRTKNRPCRGLYFVGMKYWWWEGEKNWWERSCLRST